MRNPDETPHGRRAQYSSDYYSRIGQKGGVALRAKIGPDGYRERGLRGGAATKQKYGSEYFSAIGRKGGLNRGKKLREKDA